MTHVAFDGSARAGSRAGVLEEHKSQNLNDRVRHIAVVIRAAHITTFSRQVIAVADLGFFCSSVVFIEGLS
jgi:hypothetical protein